MNRAQRRAAYRSNRGTELAHNGTPAPVYDPDGIPYDDEPPADYDYGPADVDYGEIDWGVPADASGDNSPGDAKVTPIRRSNRLTNGGAAPDNHPDVIEGEIVDDGTDSVMALKLPDGHRPTDVGNAARLIAAAGSEIRYVPTWGKWIVYRKGRWIVDDRDTFITEVAKRVSRRLFALAAKTAANGDPDGKAKLIWAWAMRTDSAASIASMIRLARGADGITVHHDDLDANPWILNVANGTINLRNGELLPHEPADLCTLQAPVSFNPDATAPLWNKCLRRWQPDPEVWQYIQTRAGASATGIPTETLDVDHGGGGNGKSKFHGAIQRVLGDYSTVPHKSLIVAGRFDQHPTVVADLFRKRLAVAAETKAAERLDEEQVKNLTGGDELKARRMKEDPWKFWPTHTMIICSNHKPVVTGCDEGTWRRLRLVPWTVTIPPGERDEHLAAKLAQESSGILNWIIDGAVRYAANGITPPAAVLAATQQYRTDEDVVSRFVAECIHVDPTDAGQRNTWMYSSDIAAELADWCKDNSLAVVPPMGDVAAKLKELGGKPGGRKQIHGKRSTIWHGISVRQGESATP